MDSKTTVKPYNQEGSKKEQVAKMFDNISERYDFLNHFFTLGIDVLWRRKAIKLIGKYNPKLILDIATGTGDFALEALRINPEKVIGTDISNGMLEKGREKIQKKGQDKVELQWADAENLPFPDNTFDAITVGFGVRNFEDLEKGLKEMLRVLKSGKPAAVLELSKPRYFPFKQLYWIYFRYLMPTIGRWISKDSAAYTYLPESVGAFPSGKRMEEILKKCGYNQVKTYPLMMGIASIYLAEK